ncbi:MAG: hypothetical protein ACI3XP_00575 [Eubacteriales bacterium]
MKKKIWIPITAAAVLLAILFVPVPLGSYDDGGTREYVALTYRIVDWNRISTDGVYENVRFYGPADRNTPIDELWEREEAITGKRGEIYTEPWLEKSDRTKADLDLIGDIRITEIYQNCFFASPVIPMPYTIKLNGELSDEWCVGDQVICTYENLYYDSETNRMEADFLTVKASDWEPEPDVAYKPVIYLYPEAETEVSVKLTLDGSLSCTYPAYNDGWTVTASPDGTLTDANGQTYSYLYWEGETNTQYALTKGFCIQGKDTAAFLEDALARLGLNRREANEYIVYWLPLMQENPYNIISFQSETYTEAAQLDISPAPDTLLRVFMTWKAVDEYVNIEAQELSAPDRIGFTVIEWGGCEVK